MTQHRSRVRWWSRAISGASLLAVLASPGTAEAQTCGQDIALCDPQGNGLDLRLFRPAVDSKGLLTVNGSDILGAGSLSFGLVADLGSGLARIGNQRMMLGPTGLADVTVPLVDSMITGTFHANLGIANVLVVGAQLPIHLVSGPNNNPPTDNPMAANGALGLPVANYNPGSGGLNYQGLGDLILHAKLRWLRAEYFPIGLAVILQAGFALGQGPLSFAGEPGAWVWPSVAVERRIGRRLRLAGNLGLRYPFARASRLIPAAGNGNEIQYGPMITFGAGASLRVGSVLDLVAEGYGTQNLDFSDTPVEAAFGAKIFVERNSYLMLGLGRRLTDGLAGANLRGFVGFVFEPSIGDTDGDGYRDDVDHCVSEPEDFDNFEDDDGCPEPDNDRDGILDVSDQCPLVPEDRNGVQDDDGCPDSEIQDRDGDRIPDNADQCPDDPEDRDEFQDQDGCPDPDNDNDQILDTDDLCPNDPEDRDNFEDDNGCPDPDNDRDTILDVRDACPNDPEVFNGLDDADGCPDNGVLQRVGTEIRLNQQINFETDSAQIVDNELNRNIVEQMSTLLRNNPEIELVEVEGHTDERAPDDHNLQLSRDRANAVMQALVAHGVAATRLVAAGYGEFCPLDPRSNDAAWARNRRVQFFIIRTAVEGRTTAAAGCSRGRQYIPASVGSPRRE